LRPSRRTTKGFARSWKLDEARVFQRAAEDPDLAPDDDLATHGVAR
jgi:hypothetical protein